MANKNALIVFVRKAELGKVKTRLAATVGNEKALAIYKKLVLYTYAIATQVQADCFIFYTNTIDEEDIWQAPNFFKAVQADGNLGYKMEVAFKEVFAKKYNHVVVIGSDCYELTANVVQQAFTALATTPIVIGPAVDGGYYLLGMQQMHTMLFEDKDWSTHLLLQQTINNCIQYKLNYTLLPLLNDVDEEKDVPPEWL
jgi:uncharacterized protein